VSDGYRNRSAEPKKAWTPVIVPRPSYASADDARRWQEAVRATPRQPGEDPCDWARRVEVKAKGLPDPDVRLPYAREPGEDVDP